ncbi:MAG: hypothetical protein MUE61_11840 [Vicinamibacterales bacterium]|nr:hypothetical protein [Vicinamibacterales bacterium]
MRIVVSTAAVLVASWACFASALILQRGDTVFPRELVSFGPPSAAPLLAGTGGDTWDRKMRERGWVMREGDGWHLWYTGYNDARSDSRFLGYATSPDGLAWTRWPGNPLTTEGWVEDMSVVKQGGTYYMFAEGRDDIAHLLTSTDRVHWKEQGSLDIRQVDGRPISAGPRGTPAVWLENGTWWLFRCLCRDVEGPESLDERHRRAGSCARPGGV